MSKDELIVNQQIQIKDMENLLKENSDTINHLIGKFYNIGAPLNDNVLQLNTNQQVWCYEVVCLIKKLNSL